MDPKDTDRNYKTENTPIVCTHVAGKMLVQLEGTHTTDTTTEGISSAEKKTVQFVDEEEGKHNAGIKTVGELSQEAEKSLSEVKFCEALNSGGKEMDIYQNQLPSAVLKGYGAFGWKIVKEKIIKPEEIALSHFDLQTKKAEQLCCTSRLTTSCDFKSVACQAQPSDYTSLNELSLLEISSLTSRSEHASSLNNYAQAENACVSLYDPQQEVIKKPLVKPVVQQTLTLSAATEKAPGSPSFNVITIEAETMPSLTDLRRPPLCHRIWDVFCDFCAATFLFLQVNRDCIFCLGFFVAFVVSVSFLTAFFYHALVMSPALWQTTENFHF